MASPEAPRAPEPPQSALSYLNGWGTSSLPPMGLATLITALHWRPFQPLPLMFAPILLLSSYLNLAGFPTDSAGLTAAWSGLYVLLAARRRPASLVKKFGARGAVRATAMGLGVANCVAGGWVYAKGDRKKDEMERRARNRWGAYKDS